MRIKVPLCILSLAAASCGLEVPPTDRMPGEGEHLPLGEMPGMKADGTYGFATQCKTFPQLTPLSDPRIIISLNGLTLRLKDSNSGFDKVYPVGVGAINDKSSSVTYDESLTMYPQRATGRRDFTIRPATVNTCKIWWTDPDTGKRLPVFAGLPFMSWYGAYGIHGPISQYWLSSGGKLKRGYVSHGCVRMEADDVAEVWAYIKGAASVPVRVQKEVDRASDGTVVDIKEKWLLSECATEADCPYSGAACRDNPMSGRKFCTVPCDYYCSDRYGYPVTFCIKDSQSSTGKGYCTYKASTFNDQCRGYDHLTRAKREPRNGMSWIKADVCKPGSRGWIGDRCLANSDCMTGRSCFKASGAAFGFCTETCTKYCPDLQGHPSTFCVDGRCRARCFDAASCPKAFSCKTKQRYNQSWVKRDVCMP